MARWTITLLVLLSILPSVFGLYFYLQDSDEKCFIEELPQQTMVIGKSTYHAFKKETRLEHNKPMLTLLDR